MALQTEAQWKQFFQSANITDDDVSTTYAKAFVDSGFTEMALPALDKDTLAELGITLLGHKLSILQYVRNRTAAAATVTADDSRPVAKATVQAKLTQLTHELTHPQFRKFGQDWIVYKQLTHLQPAQATPHLYNACDEAVQTALINTYPEFLTFNEERALEVIEATVTIRINPAARRKAFGELVQGEKEPVQTYVVRLRSAARDCAFQYPN